MKNVKSHRDMIIIFCRYATFIMYLNDVEDGGETAFPLADQSDDAVKVGQGNTIEPTDDFT